MTRGCLPSRTWACRRPQASLPPPGTNATGASASFGIDTKNDTNIKHLITMNTNDTSIDILSALQARHTSRSRAVALDRAEAASTYWTAVEAIVGLDVDPPTTDDVEDALRVLGLGLHNLADDVGTVRQILALQAQPGEAAVRQQREDASRRVVAAVADRQRLVRELEQAERLARLDLHRLDVRGIPDAVARAANIESLCRGLAARGFTGMIGERPRTKPAPVARRVRAVRDCIVDGLHRKVGDVFTTTTPAVNPKVLVLADTGQQQAARKPEPTLTANDDPNVRLADMPWTGPGFAAKQAEGGAR